MFIIAKVQPTYINTSHNLENPTNILFPKQKAVCREIGGHRYMDTNYKKSSNISSSLISNIFFG